MPNQQIDLALLKVAFPTSSTTLLVPWIEPIKSACKEFGIDTVREVASFLANIAVESQDLKALTESLNYSVAGLRATFGKHRITDAQCAAYGRSGSRPANQQMIANIVYGGEFGRKQLGNTMPGDGWTFRGQGLKQTTGRSNHEKCAKALGIRMSEWPAYIQTRVGAARSAGYFWKSNNLDREAATPGVADDRKKINGGTNGLALVEKRFNSLIKALLERGC